MAENEKKKWHIWKPYNGNANGQFQYGGAVEAHLNPSSAVERWLEDNSVRPSSCLLVIPDDTSHHAASIIQTPSAIKPIRSAKIQSA